MIGRKEVPIDTPATDGPTAILLIVRYFLEKWPKCLIQSPPGIMPELYVFRDSKAVNMWEQNGLDTRLNTIIHVTTAEGKVIVAVDDPYEYSMKGILADVKALLDRRELWFKRSKA